MKKKYHVPNRKMYLQWLFLFKFKDVMFVHNKRKLKNMCTYFFN